MAASRLFRSPKILRQIPDMVFCLTILLGRRWLLQVPVFTTPDRLLYLMSLRDQIIEYFAEYIHHRSIPGPIDLIRFDGHDYFFVKSFHARFGLFTFILLAPDLQKTRRRLFLHLPVLLFPLKLPVLPQRLPRSLQIPTLLSVDRRLLFLRPSQVHYHSF